MMPDLPNVGLERDIEQFVEVFEELLRRELPPDLDSLSVKALKGRGRGVLSTRVEKLFT